MAARLADHRAAEMVEVPPQGLELFAIHLGIGVNPHPQGQDVVDILADAFVIQPKRGDGVGGPVPGKRFRLENLHGKPGQRQKMGAGEPRGPGTDDGRLTDRGVTHPPLAELFEQDETGQFRATFLNAH